MIKVCYYKGCGIAYGEKEPLSDEAITHGLCPKHYEISLKELKAHMEKLRNKAGGFKLLIVEDSALFRQVFKKTLHDRFPSITIHEARDGEEALREADTFLPDLIFMDIRLPDENGLELTRKIKALHPEMIVVILTAYDLQEYREVSRQHADYFFSKTTANENIFALVQSILTAGG